MLHTTLVFLLFFFFFFLSSTYSVHVQKPRFDPSDADIVYQGDAAPSVGAVELINRYNFACRVGWATYAKKVPLWESGESGKVADFNSHFSFTITILGQVYGHGIVFFLAPVGFQIPPNSAGGFLGLFNTTTSDSPRNQIVTVEFDSFPNVEWDPPYEHVGINKNSISSAVLTPWNASLQSGDNTDVWIFYNASTKNLSVHRSYQNSSSSKENTSLSYQIDLKQVLPQWVMIGFSAATGIHGERTVLNSWEFSSSLDIKEEAKGKNEKKVDINEEAEEKNEKKVRVIVGLTVSGGLMIAALIVSVLFFWRLKQKKIEKERKTKIVSINNDDLEKGAGPRRFEYRDLASATNNFSEERKPGQGGFGAVYKGYLPDLDSFVAVKKISRGSRQGKKEYITEVKVISQLRHRNLVQLIGWCHEQNDFLLVYEFMPNGSLDSHLFGRRNPLTWAVRYKVTLGLASALQYLHEEWERCVVHRDIKSSNIMLDSSFNVKLGDFGLARLMDHELGPQTTGLVGTLGYLAPEYVSKGGASKESDVYSFGVVALEMATGRKAVNPVENDSEIGSLVEWVWSLYGKGKLVTSVDDRMRVQFDQKQVECLMMVGLWCAHPDRSFRPSVKQAIQALNFEATWPHLPTNMPVPTYHVPTPLVSSGEPFITTSIEAGR